MPATYLVGCIVFRCDFDKWVVNPVRPVTPTHLVGRRKGLVRMVIATPKVSTGAPKSLYQARPRTVAFPKKSADVETRVEACDASFGV